MVVVGAIMPATIGTAKAVKESLVLQAVQEKAPGKATGRVCPDVVVMTKRLFGQTVVVSKNARAIKFLTLIKIRAFVHKIHILKKERKMYVWNVITLLNVRPDMLVSATGVWGRMMRRMIVVGAFVRLVMKKKNAKT